MDYDLGAEGMAGQDGGVELRSCMEKSWRCGNAALKTDRNLPTMNACVVEAKVPDRRVMNERTQNCGNYEEMNRNGCMTGVSSTVNPGLHEDAGCVGEITLGQVVPGREYHGLRTG